MYTKWRFITFKSISIWFKIRFELKNLPFISSIRFSNFWANATSWGVGGLLGPYGSLIGVCDLDEDVEGLGAPLEVEFVKFWEVDELLFDGAGSMIWGYWKKNQIEISWNKVYYIFYNFGISPILDNTKVFPPKIFQIILLTLFWCSSCHWRKSCCCFSLNS